MPLTPERYCARCDSEVGWNPDKPDFCELCWEPRQRPTRALAEIDALRAKVAALKEAGDGLVNVFHYVQTGPETDTGAPFGPGPALARWREVREG